jgi:hypothetical protein
MYRRDGQRAWIRWWLCGTSEGVSRARLKAVRELRLKGN